MGQDAALVVAIAIASVGVVLVLRARTEAAAPTDLSVLLDLDVDPAEFDDLLGGRSLAQRTLVPMLTSVAGLTRRLTPGDLRDRTHRRLLDAGVAHLLRAEEFLVAQVAAVAVGLVLGSGMAALLGGRLGASLVVIVPGAMALLPSAWLNRRAEERREAIRRDLPNVIDLVQVAVTAGATFESALQLICEGRRGVLSVELRRVTQEMSLGVPRREAVLGLRDRIDLPEIANLTSALIQAEQLGMPLGRVLRSQAEDLRLRRRQWAREKAGKLPVKITVPLVLCIFPPILVITIGPAMSNITEAF